MSSDSKKESTIKLIDLNFHEVIYEFAMDEIDEAYAMAKELEEAGANFELRIPSVTETLADSLGASEEEKKEIERELEEEIDEHNS